MRTAKRITTACLTAIMIFQALAPSTEVFAQELDAVMEASVSAARAAGNTARSVQDAVATALEDTDQATSDDTATTPGADAGATEGGDGSTNADGSQDSTTDGTANGDASTEGDTSQGDTTADDGAADEEQADGADADAAAQADATYTFNTADDLRGAGVTNVTEVDGKVTKIEFSTDADLIKISNTNPAVYQEAVIAKSGSTGASFDVTKKDGDLEFQGFGSSDAPFKGSLDLAGVALAVNRTLFNNIELSDANKNVAVTWKGTDAQQPIVAAKVAGNNRELDANVTVATDSAELKSPLLGEVTGAMSLKATYSVQSGGELKVAIEASSGNVGLLVNTLAESASLTIGELGGTSFAASTIKTTAEGCSAGGLIGECATDSTVTIGQAIDQAIDLSAFSVIGKAASGGLIGKATNLTLSVANATTVKPARVVGDTSSACSGGVIGDVSFKDGFTVKPNMFDLGDIVTLDATQRAGALFGVADISNGDIVVQGGTYKSKLASKRDGDTGGSYGGLVGKVFATTTGDDGALRALVVQKDADSNCTIEFELASKLSDAGGVVGYVGDSADSAQPVAVVLNGVKVACKGDASARTSTGKFGGAVGVVDTRNVLDVRDFALTSEKAIGNEQGNVLYGRAAGIAGSAWNAVIKFSGNTDLSGARFAENSTTGQLVYENNNALIFAAGNGSDGKLTDDGATGWTFKRSNTASKTDDIATYGEAIRLGKGLSDKFIALDPNTHKLTLPTSLTSDGGAYTLTSVEDFAKLAITWQTNGYYPMVVGVSDNNLNGLQSSTITVNGKIDLAGTGLTGFTQDRASDSQIFSGTLNGGGTINLAVGEPYGVRDNNKASDGNGKVYRHGRLGLFAAVNGATAFNVTIAGSMKFDNQSNVDAGALAGVKVGGDTALASVTFSAGIEYESTNKDNYVHVGSIIGSMSGAGSLKIGSRESPSNVKANIVSKESESGVTCVGGAVGYVASDCVPSAAGKTVEVGGLNVSGSITINDGSAKTYAGGFIGQIAQGGVNGNTGALTSVKQVEITRLDFVGFNLTTGGSSASSSGGFLGYSWAGTEVTLGDSVNTNEKSYAITTSDSSVNSTSAKELGGLVYAASGHWIINDYAINLRGASFIAKNATTLGVLIARGSTSVSDNSFGAETSYCGLYLEDKAWWGTAYAVDGVSITAPNVETYDEWLANGVKPNSKLIDNGCNAVVSLHTQAEKLDMSGDPANDNSYQNRITPANPSVKFPQTNRFVRYYYNLDRALTRVINLNSNVMNTPEHLVLWAARQYAPGATHYFLTGDKKIIFTNNKIGPDRGKQITIDLTGYSYYPSNPNGLNVVTVQNVKIVFCYSKIRTEQENNKRNDFATQHENMHCGLIRTIANKNLIVNGVTLSGTVGRVENDVAKGSDPESVSGALVLRCAYADSGKNIATITINDLALDGLQVDGAEDRQYAPLLINAITRYVNLDVKNVTTSKYADTSGAIKIAASSLFGRLGYDKNSNQITAKFERISLPSQTDNTIFAHASLLESFGYGNTSTGSADYTFTKADAVAGMVTYGSEIDAKGKEYSGKQLWYYDEETYATDNGLVKVGDKTANADTPQFGDYLPYVYKGKATEGNVQYHEIKVNQRIPNLMTGCGTYGDPYTVKDAAEMNAIANYINNSVALDGWEVTIAANQSEFCMRRSDKPNTDNEVVYVYKQANGADKKWEKKTGNATTDPSQALSDETMHRYVQSAYYSIEPAKDSKITVDAASFGGFGNKANPFRGVIVGDLGASTATIEIENNKGELRGLIPYSYGSVVRNLNIRYVRTRVDAQTTITYSPKDADGVPTAFFGGVIGCILGGDNIIDGAVVNGTTADSPTTGFTVVGGSHLVPIGGYVGAIAGGGVIFRHMSGISWRAGTKEKFKSAGEGGGNFQLYDNPYVGRVIDGYAFSEGCAVDNGDANYKINELNIGDKSCITTGAIAGRSRGAGSSNKLAVTTTVNNAQGLLVLSAIISSGAAGGSANASTSAGTYGTPAGSRAYLGGNKAAGTYQFGNQQYGKVRNASYTFVGKPENAADDFVDAVNDDMKSPGIQAEGNALDYAGDGSDVNSPYLVKNYATWQTGYICAAQVSGMDLQFVDTAEDIDYDMTPYGSGFTGLSGRYYSNACASASGADRDRIVPLVACINGNGATIKVKNNTQEYTDDDLCVAGVGGLFNTVAFYSSRYNSESIKANNGANVRNISFEGCDISLSYITTTGTKQSTSGSNGKSGWVGTGCLAGSTANQGGFDGVAFGVFKNVGISGSAVAGGCMAGGLIGSAGLMTRSTDGSNASIVNYGGTSSPVQLYDCSYNGITVSARSDAGGFVGYINSGACGIWVSNDKTVADSSTIAIVEKAGELQSPDLNSAVGGIFGLTGGTLSVNTGQGDGARQVATISDVSLIVNHNALGVGGIAGRTVTYQSNINRVKVTSAKKVSEKTPTYFGSLGAASDTGNAHAASTGGIIGSLNNSAALNSCTVENLRMGVTEHAGGLVGATSNGNTLSATNITVDGVQFDGARCGGILGNCQGQGATNVVVANATVQNCSFGTLNSTWNHEDGSLRNHSGGIVGAASGTIKIANALIRKNEFKQPGGQGLLLGDTAQSASDFKGLYAAGVDIVLKDGSDNSSAPKPIKYFNDGAVADVDAKSYVAFGSYGQEPSAPNDGKTLYGDVAASGNVTAAVAPYVTTSPVPENALSVKTAADETGQTRYLFGDGVNVYGASTIKTDAEKGGSKHYVYTNFDGDNHWNYSPSSAGEFNKNNDTDATKTDANPYVLVLSGNDSDTVKDYLNIVTNGGYSDALRLNADGSHVSATVDVFQLKNGAFVKQADVTDKALDVKGSGSSLSISTNSNWDNGKGRFNLLTVTFTEAGQSYRVMVPIIVKRVLEINFTATYSEGSNFNSDDYRTKYDKHVLISSGETMTGYLTWTYNKAYDQETEYGWNTHLASGGDMRPLNKCIVFGGERGALPAGTQLTLVDTAHNNKEYHYTVPQGGTAASVALTDFEDSTGSHYAEQWLSETMGVTAKEADGGAWVKLTDAEKDKKTEAELVGIAGVKIGNDYYRLKTDSDEEGPFYNLTVPAKGSNEQPKSESFYLVVRTPKNSTSVNGYTGTSVTTNVNTHINYVLRKGEAKDPQQNTASTYSVATNFQHNLVDKALVDNKTSIKQMTMSGTTYSLDIDVSDTITFGEQEYTSSDALYYQLDSSLVNYEGGNAAGAHGYPTGTQGTYSFYVTVGGKYYAPYVLTESGKTVWKWKETTAADPCATTATWTADGGDMKLTLADVRDTTSVPIDLSDIREIAKEHGNAFTINMKARLTMTELACQAGIIASQNNGNDKYTKPNYRAYLSTHAETLSTSSNSAYNDGGAGYYRTNVGSSTIALEASKRSQLGINIDDLKSADGEIALVGTYDFSKLAGAEAMISSATKVTYTLTLQRRSETDGSYVDVTDDISKYVRVTDSRQAAVKAEGNAITFTDVKKDDAFGTQSGDTTFSLLFIVEVNTNVEKAKQTYANYRLVLTAQMSGGGVNDMPVNVSNLADYANSDYVTYTLARINTEGIPHETQAN